MQSNETTARASIFGAHYRLVTLGTLAIVFLTAFENLAVTTVMPVISRQLDGASLYAVAFAGPFAVGVVGMVIAGNWSDRSGPRVPLYSSVALFAIGLLVAGTATSMPILVAGRVVYGLAGGATSVALYVIVARVFPPELQPRIFGAFAAAWVFPALVGPAIAGILADTVGWRWVFLGVVVLVAVAMVMVIPAMRELGHSPTNHDIPWSKRRIGWAVLLAVAVLGLSLTAELPDIVAVVIAIVALVVAVVAARPLVPPGTISAKRGLPTVILISTVISGAYFGAEVYVPYLLTTHFGLTPSLAGLSLTGAGVAWGAASVLQGRVSDRLSARTAIRMGVVGVIVAIAAALATALFGLPVWVAIVGWAIGGAGMGTLTPRLSVLLFAYSDLTNQGFNSSALSIADSVGPGIALAIAGLLFGAVGGGAAAAGSASFVTVFVFVLVLAAVALALGGRTVGAERGSEVEVADKREL
jgi:MFS family permease